MKTFSELLSSPGKWVQGAHARSSYGISCGPSYSKACQWDFLAAIDLAYNENPFFQEAVRQLKDELKTENLVVWNDTLSRTYNEIIVAGHRFGELLEILKLEAEAKEKK